MSKYWKNMYIVHPDNRDKSDNTIISKDFPVCVDNNDPFEFDYTPPNDEVCEFINKHNKTVAGTIEQIDISSVEKAKSTNTIVIALRYIKTKRIMAVIFDTFLSLKVHNQIIPHAYTYNLCVHTKLRGKGVCMKLITEMIKFGYQHQLYCGYHLVPSPHTGNSVKIQTWFRPVNYKLAKIHGFNFLSKRLDVDRSDFRTRQYYSVREPQGITFEKINNTNLDTHYNSYINSLSVAYPFVFCPDQNYFGAWCQNYDTYIVIDNGNIVGLFSLKITHPFNPTVNKQTNVANLIWCLGKQPQTTQMALYVSKHKYQNIHILFGYLTSGINHDTLNCIHAGLTSTELHFELYNNTAVLQPYEISVPFL